MRATRSYSRREACGKLATAGVFSFLGGGLLQAAQVTSPGAKKSKRLPAKFEDEVLRAVMSTPMVDTHEHLVEESQRLLGADKGRKRCDDWALLFSHYLDSDLLVAGMPRADLDRFLSPGLDPLHKWSLLEPYWPAVKNTGYGQATRLALRELYGVDELNAATVVRAQAGYEKTRRRGFYDLILREKAGLESCQVNSLQEPFRCSENPGFLMQDISIVGMFAGPNLHEFGGPTGIEVKGLADWHRVIKWWFDQYGEYAVAVKSQNAYGRDIDYVRVPAEKAEPVFRRVLQKDPVGAEERKLLEDHLFWCAVDEATSRKLPVKLHTGYYAGQNGMPLSRVQRNAASAADLCRLAPETKFVFMHICYPYYEEILAVAKQYTNAYVDMCWSWLINPVAAADYLKKHAVTAPVTKLLPFGGDYIPVEPVLGHAMLARHGVARALTGLVDEGWLQRGDAIELVQPILRGNAQRIFNLASKLKVLQHAPWMR
jgi:uncharacterized protein